MNARKEYSRTENENIQVAVQRSSMTTATISWRQLHHDTEVCVTLRDVTEIRFPHQAGEVLFVPDRLVTPDHTYKVTVRRVTTGALLEAKHNLPTGTKISWSLDDANVDVDIIVKDVTEADLFVEPAGRAFVIPEEYITPGHKYEITVNGMTSLWEGKVDFRAEFTPTELHSLHDKAIEYENSRWFRGRQTEYFYRNNTAAYFDMCEERYSNKMRVNLKDYNGNAASAINGEVKGLFFCANGYKGTRMPPPWTYFGPKRVCIPAAAMLTEDSNLYFADFYCYKNDVHYVTLVLTRPGSESDRFCEEKLYKLDTGDNPFLYRSDNDTVWVSCYVWVEVLYTEDVDLSRSDCFFWPLILESRGTSTPGGLSKNRNCTVCNLRGVEYEGMSSRRLKGLDEDNASYVAVGVTDQYVAGGF